MLKILTYYDCFHCSVQNENIIWINMFTAISFLDVFCHVLPHYAQTLRICYIWPNRATIASAQESVSQHFNVFGESISEVKEGAISQNLRAEFLEVECTFFLKGQSNLSVKSPRCFSYSWCIANVAKNDVTERFLYTLKKWQLKDNKNYLFDVDGWKFRWNLDKWLGNSAWSSHTV